MRSPDGAVASSVHLRPTAMKTVASCPIPTERVYRGPDSSASLNTSTLVGAIISPSTGPRKFNHSTKRPIHEPARERTWSIRKSGGKVQRIRTIFSFTGLSGEGGAVIEMLKDRRKLIHHNAEPFG